MWNNGKSLVLSIICCITFMLFLLLVCLYAPYFVSVRIVHISHGIERLFLMTIYSGAITAAVLLGALFVLLLRIGKGRVFDVINTSCLRLISWCCFVGGIISALSALYYAPWVIIGIAAGFMGLIMRVLKNVFAKAVELQDDAEYTI